jgi:hypothetical protein
MSEKYLTQSAAVASRMLDGEMVIMSAIDSTLFSLNPVATAIWKAADGRTPLSRIVEKQVCEMFDVDRETAYRDALEFAEALAQKGILRISDAPLPEPAASEAVR